MEDKMYLDLVNYDMTKFTPKFIAQIRQKRQLGSVATEFDCRGAASVTVPIMSGGKATPHIPGTRIPSFGGGVRKGIITTHEWDAGDYLDYFLLDKNNFSYETVVEKTLIPDAVCQRMDQTILDALDAAENPPTLQATVADPLAAFADIKAMMDSQELYIPQEDRFLILPAAAQPEFFTNDKMMSNNYVQLQLNNISEGKIGMLLGFRLIFLNDIKGGGLPYISIDGGASRVWTCYATSKVSIGHAVGYGANRTADGTGGIFKVQEIASEGGYFINAPFCDGAKVLLPNGIVRFTMQTKNYNGN
jgi:hypothetical protein